MAVQLESTSVVNATTNMPTPIRTSPAEARRAGENRAISPAVAPETKKTKIVVGR
jgi:hypothetical protein